MNIFLSLNCLNSEVKLTLEISAHTSKESNFVGSNVSAWCNFSNYTTYISMLQLTSKIFFV